MRETKNYALKLIIFYLGTSFLGLLLTSSDAMEFEIHQVQFYTFNKLDETTSTFVIKRLFQFPQILVFSILVFKTRKITENLG